MRVLVTGSEGFIGSWLCPELTGHGHQVDGIDIQGRPDFVQDLTIPGAFNEQLELRGPYDAVVHLAAQVGREFGEDDVAHTVEQNATMTTLVARACAQHDVKLLYVSSSEVYGDQGDTNCYEYGDLKLPHNLYGLSKRWGEEACRLYMEDWNLAIARLSMPYGPGAPPGRGRRAMDNFLWWAHHGKPITVHRDAVRSWCWVGDTVRGLRLILEDRYHEGLTEFLDMPEIFNVGRDDKPVSMAWLAAYACYLTDQPLSLVKEVDPPPRQTVVKKLDTDRLRSLGWKPTVNLHEGMQAVYDWVRRFDENGEMIDGYYT